MLLFDEPLSNLDARLRLPMRGEIKRLQVELGITSIYVTRDQVEAMTMADRIAVIKDGYLQAYCPPDELYDEPRTVFIGVFVGNPSMNFMEVEVTRENGTYRARREGVDVIVPPDRAEKVVGRGHVIMGFRPEDITIADEGIKGEAYVVEPLGRDDLLDVRIGEAGVHVLADPTLGIRMGQNVSLEFHTQNVQFLDPETEKSCFLTARGRTGGAVAGQWSDSLKR